MKRIVLIACYFGKLPNYFEYWQMSCFYNKDIDFILFTDQSVNKVNENFKVVNISLDKLKEKINKKGLYTPQKFIPYKLCDYKPAYGKIFEDYISQYEFWGYCDIDLIFGNISKYITDDILNENDIILNLGHLTIYRNKKELCEMYKNEGAIYNYKTVYMNNENFAFDEMSGMHRILKREKIKPYLNIPIADIDKRYSRYKLYDRKNFKKQIFLFDSGIYRYYEKDGEFFNDEYIYLHFQKKKIYIDVHNNEKFIIGSNGFLNIDDDIEKILEKYNIYYGKSYEIIELLKYYVKKIQSFFKMNTRQKKIWIKQKVKI